MSFLLGLFAVVARLANYYSLPGWASILLAISFIGGVQLIVTGVLGLYVERIYNEVKSRPLYVLDERQNLDLADRTAGPKLVSQSGATLGDEEDKPAKSFRS
jgi:dolichol-phosphate mannosyltransferase